MPALIAYVGFWAVLLQLVWKRFAARGEMWPACALVVLFPSMVTDLGFQHYEKAVMVVLLAAFCMALPDRKTPASPVPIS